MRSIHFLVAILAASFLGLWGCDRAVDAPDSRDAAGGAVAFRLADSLVAALAPQADSVRVTVGRSGSVQRAVSAPLGAWIQIDSLPIGTCDLQVDLYQAGGWISWSGKTTVQVLGGRTVDATVHLARATGNIHIQVVLDSIPVCSVVVAPRSQVVHVTTRPVPLNSLRRIVSVRSDVDSIRIAVRSEAGFSVPTIVLVQGKEGVTLTVGDPFFECGGITGPCIRDSVSDSILNVVVPWNEVPSCAGQVSVTGNGNGFLIYRPGVACVGGGEVYFRWESTGGFAGGGTGESVTLLASGVLQRVLRDGADPARLDTSAAFLDSGSLAHVDSILARSDVRALPAPEDTAASGWIADAMYDRFRIEGASRTILDLTFGGRYCQNSSTAEPHLPNLESVYRADSDACPTSPGTDALYALLAFLRAVPSGGAK